MATFLSPGQKRKWSFLCPLLGKPGQVPGDKTHQLWGLPSHWACGVLALKFFHMVPPEIC